MARMVVDRRQLTERKVNQSKLTVNLSTNQTPSSRPEVKKVKKKSKWRPTMPEINWEDCFCICFFFYLLCTETETEKRLKQEKKRNKELTRIAKKEKKEAKMLEKKEEKERRKREKRERKFKKEGKKKIVKNLKNSKIKVKQNGKPMTINNLDAVVISINNIKPTAPELNWNDLD